MARVPCLVFIVPAVPAANGPLSVIDCTSGFHSGQVLVSDQIFHAAWGLAVVSTERSLFANPLLPLLLCVAGRPAIENQVYQPGQKEADDRTQIRTAKPVS